MMRPPGRSRNCNLLQNGCMARSIPEESQLNLYAASYLFAQGERAVDICAQLDLEPPKVARLRSRAIAQELLEVRPPVLGPRFTAEMERAALALLQPDPLSKKLRAAEDKKLLRAPVTIRVYPSASRGTAPSDWDLRLKEFGRECARHVADLLPRTGHIGVSWGASLDAVVTGIEELALPKRVSGEQLHFVPTCGEPLGRVPDKASASNMAGRLDTAINGSRRHSFSLSGVPFLIPIDFGDVPLGEGPSETAVVRKLIARVPAHAQIFGGTPGGAKRDPRGGPLAGRLSMILTSISPEGLPFGHGAGEYLASAGVDVEKLRMAALGDISGVVLPRPGRAGHPLLTKISSHWTGISMEQLESCAARTGEAGDRFGITVVAIGAAKAACVLESLRRGLVTHLVIDSDLEVALRTAAGALK